MPADSPITLPEEALRELRRHNLLKNLIKRQVIAEAVGGVELEAEAVEQARQLFCRKHNLADAEAIEAYAKAQGLSGDDLTWQIQLPLRIRAHCAEHYRQKAEAHFLIRKHQLDRVVYSLLRVKDPYLARELYLRIDAREANFADLAAAYSEGPEKQTKGIVGPVSLTQAHPALAEKLRTSRAGELMTPFQIGEWWLVARLENYTPANFDAAMAEQLCAELFEAWVKEETTRRIALL